MKPTHLAPGDLVIITWLDAVNHAGWIDPAEETDERYAQVDTIGKVVKVEEDMVTLATSWGHVPGGDVGGVWQIPCGWIINITSVVEE